MIPSEDIERRFAFHPADEAKGVRHDRVRDLCKQLAHRLNIELTDGREKSLAMTNLESVMMWSNASIAREGK